MVDAINTAISGLNKASQQVERSATNIASGNSPNTLIEDIVDIRVVETAFKANIATLRVADELTQELLRTFDETV